jgi:hypothetical protein
MTMMELWMSKKPFFFSILANPFLYIIHTLLKSAPDIYHNHILKDESDYSNQEDVIEESKPYIYPLSANELKTEVSSNISAF